LASQTGLQEVTAAPTGIAALTVSGTTIHRLFKFPPAWILESDINYNNFDIFKVACSIKYF
jgi:hypothetical protein